VLEVPFEGDPDALLPLASAALRRVDGGHGRPGPDRPLRRHAEQSRGQGRALGTPVRRVSALSLPMLLRVMNYAEEDLDELPMVAGAGARNGVIVDEA
jgi:PTS system ascorbate-specific IIA component